MTEADLSNPVAIVFIGSLMFSLFGTIYALGYILPLSQPARPLYISLAGLILAIIGAIKTLQTPRATNE